MCFSRRPWASERSRGAPPAVVLCSGGIVCSFRGGVVPGLSHPIKEGHGPATGLCSLPKGHAAHGPSRRGAHVGCQGLRGPTTPCAQATTLAPLIILCRTSHLAAVRRRFSRLESPWHEKPRVSSRPARAPSHPRRPSPHGSPLSLQLFPSSTRR